MISDDNRHLLERSRARAAQMLASDPWLRTTVAAPDALEAIERAGRTSVEACATVFDRYASRTAFSWRRSASDLVEHMTFAEVWNRSVRLATGLVREKLVAPGDMVGVCAFTAPDSVLATNACLYLMATFVPLHAPTTPETLARILNETELRVVIVDREQLPAFLAVLPACPGLKSLVVISSNEAADLPVTAGGARLYDLRALEAHGSGLATPMIVPRRSADPALALYYTSGSTGTPKGALFPESVWRRSWLPSGVQVFPYAESHRWMPLVTTCFMPLSHGSGLHHVHCCLVHGGVVHFTRDSDLSGLFDDVRLSGSTFLNVVPRVLEQMYQHYRLTIARGESEDAVLERMRDTFLGRRLLGAVCGSAPMSATMFTFLRRCFQAPFFNRWGSTEAGNVTFDDQLGSNVIDFKIVDVPELGYSARDLPYPRGELYLRTKRQISGYFKNAAATAALFDTDGYLKTGDLVERRGERGIVWLNRKNDVLKLSNGEFVTVWHIEDVLVRDSRLIRQAFVYGNSRRPYLLAVLVPREPDTSVSALHAEIARVAKHGGLRAFEIPRQILVAEEPFSKENGLLTSSNKLARAALKERYGAELEALYEQLADVRLAQHLELERSDAPVFERVRRAAAVLLARDDIDPTRTFAQLGADSLDAVRFSELLERTLGVSVPAAFLVGNGRTLEDIAAFVTSALDGASSGVSFESVHGPDPSVVRAADLSLEKVLHASDLEAARAAAPASTAAPETVLLTGANGFLGRALLLELAFRPEPTSAKTICLVRAANDAVARERLLSAVGKTDPSARERLEELERAGRLCVFAADLTLPSLGLDPTREAALARDVDTIVHNGALVNHGYSYRQLFGPNVRGTASLLRLAITAKKKRIAFVSTGGVVRDAAGTNVEELTARELGEERVLTSGYASGYTTSKWASEVLLGELSDRFDVPVRILRCGLVLAHSTTRGEIAEADYFTRLLCGLVHTRVAPKSFGGEELAAAFRGLPVDFIARAIVRLSLTPWSGHGVYHVMNPPTQRAVTWDSLLGFVESYGYRLERVSSYDAWYAEFRARLEALGERALRSSPLPIVERWKSPRTDRSATMPDTRRFEAEIGAIPEPTEAFVHKCLDDLRALELIDPPGAVSASFAAPG